MKFGGRLAKIEVLIGRVPATPTRSNQELFGDAWKAFRRMQARIADYCAELMEEDGARKPSLDRVRAAAASWWRQADVWEDPDRDLVTDEAHERDVAFLNELQKRTGWCPDPPGRDVLTPYTLGFALALSDVYCQVPFAGLDPRYESLARLVAWHAQSGEALAAFVAELADLRLLRWRHLGPESACECTWCELDRSDSFSGRMRRLSTERFGHG